jgi:hypothetical protein
MASITIDDLIARRDKLRETREHELREHELREAGYRFVLGELSLMIEQLEKDSHDEQQLAALEQTPVETTVDELLDTVETSENA